MIKTKWITPQVEQPKPKPKRKSPTYLKPPRRVPVVDLLPHITGSMTTLQIANRVEYSRGYILRALNDLEAAGKVRCEVVKIKGNRPVLHWTKL